MVLAITLARGGSKEIKKKNKKLFLYSLDKTL